MTDRDRAILILAGAYYLAQGHRLDAARSKLGLGSTAFYAAVARLLDDPDAEAWDPVLVRRLRRVRDAERARRFSGRRAA